MVTAHLKKMLSESAVRAYTPGDRYFSQGSQHIFKGAYQLTKGLTIWMSLFIYVVLVFWQFQLFGRITVMVNGAVLVTDAV